ncbi:aldo/keto reductase [Streptomyces triculaminicus]|uniref:aldo/keto reductase n=1 Tax=Streptomyces triculaminicus TaxID=2816232 RepID=UPI00379BEE7B
MSAVLGLGTYKVRDAATVSRTVCAAGAAWVDTAPNYGGGATHRLLAPVLAENPQAKVATKTGFFTPAQQMAAAAAGAFGEEQARSGHSLAPAFVRWQTEQSLHELGRADVVFVHNPERSARHRQQVHTRLRKAFEVLEEFACAGRIGGYGVATWSGFESGVFNVPGLVGLARQAAGGQAHHLVAVQQPVSLVMDRPIRQSLGGRGPLVQARAAGLTTFASSPLHGGELIDLVTPELVEFIRPGLSPAAACLLVAASTPSLDVVLLSASSSRHWTEAAAALALPLDARRLTEVTDVCAAR